MVFRAICRPTIDIYIKCSEAVKLFIARVTAVTAGTCEFACTDRQTDRHTLWWAGSFFFVVVYAAADDDVGLFWTV